MSYTPGTVTSIQQLNTELTKISNALADTLQRKPKDGNFMDTDLDMNSKRILNLPTPISETEPARVKDVAEIASAAQGKKLVRSSTEGFPEVGIYPEGTELKFYDTLDEYVLIRSETGALQWVEEGNVGDEVPVTAASHLTLAQAQASDLKVGQYVRLTDRGYALAVLSDSSNFSTLSTTGGGLHLNLVSTPAYAEHFGIEYNAGYQDAKLLQMFEYSENKNCRCYYSGKINLNTNINIAAYPNLQFFGVGDESELHWPDLSTGVGFSTGGVQHTAVSIEKMKISAPPSSSLQVCKFAELYQGCRVSDLIIQGGDVGCEITDSWVSCFDNLYIRDGGTYGMIVRSPTADTQVNALNLGGIYVQGYQHNWFFDGVSGGGRAINIPSGASEKSRKTSMVIDGFGSVNLGSGFYFEQNYTDAQGVGTDILDKTKPVDVLIKRTGGVFDATITYDKTYFARANNFNSPTLIVGMYVDTSVPAYIIHDNMTTHVCNTTSYVDYDVYNDSSNALVTQVTGKSNSKGSYCGGVTKRLVNFDANAQTQFTSTWSLHNQVIDASITHFIDLKCTTGGATTSSMAIIVKDTLTLLTVATLTIPAATYAINDTLRFRIPRSSSATAYTIEINSPAAGDNVTFTTHLYRAKVGADGSYFNGTTTSISN